MEERLAYKFKMRKQWWIDAGIGGFFNIASDVIVKDKYDIKLIPEDDGLLIIYSDGEELKDLLKECYQLLVDRYWNVSTKRQIDNPELIFYDKVEDKLSLKPKRQPTPVPSLFVKGSSWRTEDGEPYNELSPEMKKRVELFREETKKDLWGKKKILLYALPVCHTELEILPEEAKRKKICSVCGRESSNCNDISQPSYLLFASGSATRSFNSEVGGPDKICWECEYLSKFAVESASYEKKGDSLFILQVVTANFEKLIDTNYRLGCSSVLRQLDDEYYYSNIRKHEKSLLRYASLPYEFLWGFYCDAYTILNEERKNREQDKAGDFLDELLGLSLSIAPIKIALFYIQDKGQTFITKDLIFYDDSAYAFRLIHSCNEVMINQLGLFNSLYSRRDKQRENHFRNKFFSRVLNKRTVLMEAEKFAFHVSSDEQPTNWHELLLFLQIYEPIIGEVKMNKEQVETAVNLGKSIVIQAEQVLKGDELKKIKGDLFALRKCRTKIDFLNQLNTLQLRYGLTVSNKLTEGILEEVPFDEFRAYCTLAALNSYNSLMRKQAEGGKENERS